MASDDKLYERGELILGMHGQGVGIEGKREIEHLRVGVGDSERSEKDCRE